MITSQQTLTGVLESITVESLTGSGQVHVSDSDQAYIVRSLQGDAFNVIRGLWKERREQGLTQAMLAKRLGVKEAQISKWMRRPQNLTLKSLAKLALSMGVVLGFTGELMERRPLQNYRPDRTNSVQTDDPQKVGTTAIVTVKEWDSHVST